MTTLLLAQLFFGLCLPLNKMALNIVPPLLFVGIRLTVGGLLLLGCTCLRGIQIKQTTVAVLLPLMPTILLGIMLKGVCKYHALYNSDIAHTALLLATTPLWAALFSRLLLNEKLTRKQGVAILLGTVAATMYALSQFTTNTPRVWPTLLLTAALVVDAYSYVLLRTLAVTRNTPKTLVSGLRMFCGGLPLLALALASGEQYANATNSTHVPVLSIAIAGGCVTHLWYLHLLKRYPAPLVALADLLGPMLAVLFAWIMLQEQPTGLACVSGSMVLFALILFNRGTKESRQLLHNGT